MCDMTHSNVRYDSFTCATWPIDTCDITPSHVDQWRFIHMCDTNDDSHDNTNDDCVTWRIHTRGMTPMMTHTKNDANDDAFQINNDINDDTNDHTNDDTTDDCVTWLIHMCNMTPMAIHSKDNTNDDAYQMMISMTRLMTTLMTIPLTTVWHDSFICAARHQWWLIPRTTPMTTSHTKRTRPMTRLMTNNDDTNDA